MKNQLLSAASVVFALALSNSALADVTNGGFEDAGGVTISASGSGYLGHAANGWDVWNNASTSTLVEHVSPSTDPFAPGGGNNMIHVVTGGLNNGIYAVPGNFGRITGDFYVVRGVAALQSYDGGQTGSLSTTATGVWQHLTLNNVNGNEITLYSASIDGVEFYADNIHVSAAAPSEASSVVSFSAAPEPSAWALMMLGVGSVGAALRRRKMATA